MNKEKGREIEASYGKEVYAKDSYFEITQLQSQVFQLTGIRRFSPKKIIEVGVGSGFTSIFLRRAGYSVTTIDINKNLEPDICCDISEILQKVEAKEYDLAVCCQVLEHLPFDEFEACIERLSKFGNLYLTLPNYFSYFGFAGILRIPHIRKPFSLYLKSPLHTKKLNESIHYWEIDSDKETRRKSIVKILKKYFNKVDVEIIPTNPYHLQFFCYGK